MMGTQKKKKLDEAGGEERKRERKISLRTAGSLTSTRGNPVGSLTDQFPVCVVDVRAWPLQQQRNKHTGKLSPEASSLTGSDLLPL